MFSNKYTFALKSFILENVLFDMILRKWQIKLCSLNDYLHEKKFMQYIAFHSTPWKSFVINYMYSLWKVYSLSFMVKLDRYSLLIRVYLLHWREKLYHLITAKDDISTRKINDTKWTSDCSTISIQPVTSIVILKRFFFKTSHLMFSSVRSFYVR